MHILLRWLINAAALLLAAYLIPGFVVSSFYAALIAALVLGLLNALVRPVLILLTLPINVLTLGLFTFVINAVLILFMGTIVKGVAISGFGSALLAALFLWAVGFITSRFIGQRV